MSDDLTNPVADAVSRTWLALPSLPQQNGALSRSARSPCQEAFTLDSNKTWTGLTALRGTAYYTALYCTEGKKAEMIEQKQFATLREWQNW